MDSKIDLRQIKADELKTIDPDTVDIDLEAPDFEPQRQYYFMAKCRRYVKEFEKKQGRCPTFFIQTFGCQMNAKDSEKLAGILTAAGYTETASEAADLVLYNTCTVRENANAKVYGRIGYLGSLKEKHPDMTIALCGCMMQEPQVIEKIKKSYRFVDIVFGTHNIYKLAELIYRRKHGEKQVIEILPDAKEIVEELPSEHKYRFKAGVNIMYGCNNFCSYCIVPYVRGRERSRKPEDILAEIRTLAAEGIVEIMLLGQNVNSYGKTLSESISFAELLQRVEEIEGIRRIRFMTSHPKDLSDELIEVMKNSKKICCHLHLPVQSGSTRILEKMNRRYTKEGYLALVKKIRTAIPDISLTTDIIVGFPGETEEDFKETLDVVEQAGFSSAYTFLYSKRSNTPAAKMDDQVPEDIAKERFGRLLQIVSKQSGLQAEKDTGRIMEVLVEEQNAQNPELLTGRLSNNLLVHFPGNEELIGSFVTVKLEECKGFYYLGTLWKN